mgnify:CR=1 FL=1
MEYAVIVPIVTERRRERNAKKIVFTIDEMGDVPRYSLSSPVNILP